MSRGVSGLCPLPRENRTSADRTPFLPNKWDALRRSSRPLPGPGRGRARRSGAPTSGFAQPEEVVEVEATWTAAPGMPLALALAPPAPRLARAPDPCACRPGEWRPALGLLVVLGAVGAAVARRRRRRASALHCQCTGAPGLHRRPRSRPSACRVTLRLPAPAPHPSGAVGSRRGTRRPPVARPAPAFRRREPWRAARGTSGSGSSSRGATSHSLRTTPLAQSQTPGRAPRVRLRLTGRERARRRHLGPRRLPLPPGPGRRDGTCDRYTLNPVTLGAATCPAFDRADPDHATDADPVSKPPDHDSGHPFVMRRGRLSIRALRTGSSRSKGRAPREVPTKSP